MNRCSSAIASCSLAVAAALALSSNFSFAQSLGQSRFIPNPVPSAGGRVNIPDPSRHQGNGQFATPRSGGRIHNGIDLSAEVGTPVQSVGAGRVIRSEASPAYCSPTSPNDPVPPSVTNQIERRTSTAGNNVVVQHPNGTTSYYYHLNGENQPQVGDRVAPGQVIGRVGRSGNVPDRADPHLHLEIRDSNGPVRPEIEGMRTTQPHEVDMSESVVPRQMGVSSPTAGLRWPR